jgi:hypothetical protein
MGRVPTARGQPPISMLDPWFTVSYHVLAVVLPRHGQRIRNLRVILGLPSYDPRAAGLGASTPVSKVPVAGYILDAPVVDGCTVRRLSQTTVITARHVCQFVDMFHRQTAATRNVMDATTSGHLQAIGSYRLDCWCRHLADISVSRQDGVSNAFMLDCIRSIPIDF